MTRRLECENRYDEGAWGDHHWEATLAKRKEISDTTNHSSPIVSGYDDIFARKTPTSDANPSQISETNNSSSCQNSFTPVSRGAKPAKCNESNVYLNVSNRFTILEIEPCMESFHVKNVKEHQSLDKPLISKAIKKKKKNAKRKTTLEHSKVIEEICLKNNKIDNLAKCELRCNLCFKEHFPQSKFCRWSEEKKNSKKLSVKTKSTNLSEDTINLVKKKIQYLQDGRKTRKDVQMKKINDAFLKRSQNASDPLNYPDLLGPKVYKLCPSKSKESYNLEDTSNLKLRGGGGRKCESKEVYIKHQRY